MEFDDKYTGNPDFCRDGEDGRMETYGEDLEKVREQFLRKPKTVWTVVDCDGKLLITAGMHFVNRMLYFVSNEEWTSDEEEYVW